MLSEPWITKLLRDPGEYVVRRDLGLSVSYSGPGQFCPGDRCGCVHMGDVIWKLPRRPSVPILSNNDNCKGTRRFLAVEDEQLGKPLHDVSHEVTRAMGRYDNDAHLRALAAILQAFSI
jgi:hypothetical protein